jgi:hypothetical protein
VAAPGDDRQDGPAGGHHQDFAGEGAEAHVEGGDQAGDAEPDDDAVWRQP